MDAMPAKLYVTLLHIINGVRISWVHSTKFLGVYVDEALSYEIYTIALKIAKNVGVPYI